MNYHYDSTETKLKDNMTTYERQFAPARPASFISRHWFFIFNLIFGLYIGLPFLAPVFMKIGWSEAARVIYFIYSWLCHQLPERSFFLFGPQSTYSLVEVQSAWQNTLNPMILRQFIGNDAVGWKVAWSDRMTWMYTFMWLIGLLWWPLRRRVKGLPWWGFVLFLLPMAVDGGTQFISDLSGVEQGFRDTNTWLAVLTQHAFPASFYAGTVWGSFNSLMRMFTGFSFGLGIVWFGYHYLDQAFSPIARSAIHSPAATSPLPPPQPAIVSNPEDSHI
jgi:uncharacterized membrane protein